MTKSIWSTLILLMGISLSAAAQDVQRGNHWDALLRDGTPVYDDPEVTARVTEIGQKVVSASGNPLKFEFRFIVLNSTDPTAFAAPGGLVYVTTGLLRNLESEDELAAVIAHEIGHINERHPMKTGMGPGAKKFWGTVIVLGSAVAGNYLGSVVADAMGQYGSSLAASYAANMVNTLTQIATSEVGQRIVVSFYQGYKDEFEFKADELALTYTKNSGYKPEALLKVFERLSSYDGEINALGVSKLHAPKTALTKRSALVDQQLKAKAVR